MSRRLVPAFAALILVSAAIPLFSPAQASARQRVTAAPHVMVIMLENRGYDGTLASCSSDPYLCSLASQYTSMTKWTGVRHPSLPNYLATTTGSTQGCTSDVCFGPDGGTSLGGQLTTAGVPWTAYMESMPSACYTGQWAGGGTKSKALYAEKHDPFVIMSDVLKNACATHVLPYPGASALTSALSGSSAPAFVWISPNQLNDMHTGSVQAGDKWLKANVAPVLASSWFTGGNATVVITMDEDTGSNVGGGGVIPMVVIRAAARGHGNVATPGNLYGLLRSIEGRYGLSYLGAAAQAANGDLSPWFG
ncbi:MAG: alkaline phosphatase family protein [Candidatus Dormibacteraeota bacterium]|nr:alkaline phosphatase family protein [Candidatus Dormibacteraeota bacterium]